MQLSLFRLQQVRQRVLRQVQVLRQVLLLNSAINIDTASMSTEEIMDLVRRQKLAETMKYAVIFIANAPVLAMYPFVQKYFTKGVMIGSVKG